MTTTTASRTAATDSTIAPRRFTGAPAHTDPSDESRADGTGCQSLSISARIAFCAASVTSFW